MKRDYFKNMLLAFAVGDTLGMPTEFMTQGMIKKRFGFVEEIIDPKYSLIHTNLKKGTITDDTEQVIYLIREYYKMKKVDPFTTTSALLRWIEETGAKEKGYIGPSSLSALEKIKAGEAPENAGKGGTTCGAPMRVLAPVFSVKKGDIRNLKDAIYYATLPTHNTSIAMEAAFALGYIYHLLPVGPSLTEILKGAQEFGDMGRQMVDVEFVGPSSVKRIAFLEEKIKDYTSPQEVMEFLYNIIGCTMESPDVVSAAIGIFLFAKEDTWLAIRMGASIGGDTDTIAAISGALSYLYGKNFNIPSDIVEEVIGVNNITFEEEAEMLLKMYGE